MMTNDDSDDDSDDGSDDDSDHKLDPSGEVRGGWQRRAFFLSSLCTA